MRFNFAKFVKSASQYTGVASMAAAVVLMFSSNRWGSFTLLVTSGILFSISNSFEEETNQ